MPVCVCVCVCVCVDRPSSIDAPGTRTTYLFVLSPRRHEPPREPALALALLALATIAIAVAVAVAQRRGCSRGLEHDADRGGGQQGRLLPPLLLTAVVALVGRGVGEPQQARVPQRRQLAQAPE